MSKYARIHTSVQVAAATDYRGGRMVGFEQTETPDEYMVGMVFTAETSSISVPLGHYGEVYSIIVHNESTTTAVSLTYTSTSTSANEISLGAGKTTIIPDADPSDDGTLVAATASGTADINVTILGT